DSQERSDIEGNFLDHAVDSVEETVREELDRCPEHDPLLLLAVEILRASAPDDRWSDATLPCPVEDDQSPAREVPPPPPG
ncbi:MAG: hypothetical protein ABEL76_10525, partial [Bradymonadaceae bacterium]